MNTGSSQGPVIPSGQKNNFLPDCTRVIFHIDMNAFYCSCHAAENPELYGNRKTAVAGSPETRHGVVVTASYAARSHGVRATMTVPQALRACPGLILLAPDFDLYRAYSRRVFALIREYTPQVQVFSIDECFADVTHSSQFGTFVEMARTLQDRILHELGLPCSIGIGPNKFLAKMASDMKKPLGITILLAEDVESVLWPLSVRTMFGVGEKTAERLQNLGILTIKDLAHADVQRLARSLGKRAHELFAHANGLDDSPVISERPQAKSVGHSITLAQDVREFDALRTVLLNLSDQVGRRLRQRNLWGKTIEITIRYDNRKTMTHALTLAEFTNLTETIYETAVRLFSQHWHNGRPVRLLGVRIAQLRGHGKDDAVEVTEQLSLFDVGDGDSTDVDGLDATIASMNGIGVAGPLRSPGGARDQGSARHMKLVRLTQVVDSLRDKFGEDAVIRGRMLAQSESRDLLNHKVRGTSLQKDPE